MRAAYFCGMAFNPVEPAFVEALVAALGADLVHTDTEQRLAYGHDETEDLSHPPEVVVRPRSTARSVARW